MAKRDTGKSERLHQSVARTLGTQILTQRLMPGDPIDGEIENSAAMGVSRTAYREAIRILVAKGLLESRPRTGTRVTARSSWQLLDPEVLAWMFSQEPDERFVKDLFELRNLIEPAAAELAAQRRTVGQVGAMGRCIETMREHGLGDDAGQDADRRFHRLLLEATGNEALVSLSSSIGAAVQWTTRFKQQVRRQPRDPLNDHLAVYDAVADADAPRARAAMQHLLMLALSDMRMKS